MAEQVDARGLSCPQPVIDTRRKMEEVKTGTIEVLVDTDTSKENVARLAENQGWTVEIQEEGTGYRLILKKE